MQQQKHACQLMPGGLAAWPQSCTPRRNHCNAASAPARRTPSFSCPASRARCQAVPSQWLKGRPVQQCRHACQFMPGLVTVTKCQGRTPLSCSERSRRRHLYRRRAAIRSGLWRRLWRPADPCTDHTPPHATNKQQRLHHAPTKTLQCSGARAPRAFLFVLSAGSLPGCAYTVDVKKARAAMQTL